MSTVLISGANRGIGLGFCKQYAEKGWNVHACCRNPEQATELKQLSASYPLLTVHAVDVQNHNDIDDLAKQLSTVNIEVLIANAGIYGDSREHGFGNLDYQEWFKTFETNVMGVVKMAEAFLPNLKRSQKPVIAALSSQMGSIADNGSGGSILYRSSKAALNAAMKSLAIDLQDNGIGVLIFHPGWVKTDMGGQHALIDVQTSVSGMIEQISFFKMPQTGSFIKYDGSILPW